MSFESAKAFIERMKTDEDFRNKVTQCKDAEARKALVVNDGFDFTVEEIRECGGRLSEEELNTIVAGGEVFCPSGDQCIYGGYTN